MSASEKSAPLVAAIDEQIARTCAALGAALHNFGLEQERLSKEIDALVRRKAAIVADALAVESAAAAQLEVSLGAAPSSSSREVIS